MNIVEELHPYSLSRCWMLCDRCNDDREYVKDTESGQWFCSDCLDVLDVIPF